MRQKALISILFMAITGCLVTTSSAATGKTLSETDLLKLLTGGVYSDRIVSLLHERGINFIPTPHDLSLLQRAGADEGVLNAVVAARRVVPELMQNPPKPRLAPPSTNPPVFGAGPNALSVRQAAIPAPSPLPAPATLAVGTTITMQNWRQYTRYMPYGMSELFGGHRFWQMPADIAITIGPTIPEKMPAGYNVATERYSGSVEVVHLADGQNDIRNYLGGEPFPHPQEPDKGYKLLADLWFAYVPHLLVGTSENPLTICSETGHGYVNCERLSYVSRQAAYNTDGEASAEELKGSDYLYTEWLSVEEPEELRYTTLLTLYPKDNPRQKERFEFIPALRRWIRSSLASACSPVAGTDYAEDDFRRGGFNGGLSSFDAKFLQRQQIVALTGDYAPLGGDYPTNYYAPLGWPKPSWGNWQLRDVDVIDVRRIPSERASYCYGKRIIYEDAETHYALWEDGYDKNMQFWKTAILAQRLVNVPSLGLVPGAISSTAWDLENRHLTNATTQSTGGHDVLVDGEIPPQYRNFVAYATPAGLAEIMR